MGDFELVRPPVLAGAPILRDGLLRLDTARQEAAWATAQVVVVDQQGRSAFDWTNRTDQTNQDPPPPAAPSGPGPRLRTHAATDVAGTPPTDALLLGEADGVAYWGMRGEPELGSADDSSRRMNLYTVGAELKARDAALFATTVALLTWHDNARFCARDGSPTRLSNAGWARVCEAEQHEEFPRSDPAVICLVHDGADRLLLARHRAWPAGRFSVLAGFVEAGESLEACVAREVAEEVGIDVSDIGYLGSQSWPFPRSLMIGFHAVAHPEQLLRLDETEIAEAMWVHRDDLREALSRSDWGVADETDGGLIRLPGLLSIARTMIDSWVATR